VAVLLRDDFTGSGVLAGRTPDGVNAGAWADDNWFWGGSAATDTSVSTGFLRQTNAGATYGASAPLAGSPADAYIEANLRASTNNGGGSVSTISLALRRVPASSTRVCCDFFVQNSTTVNVNIVGGASGDFTVTNALNYIARFEIVGAVAKAYLNGTLVLTSTLTGVTMTGGRAYIDNNGNNNTAVNTVDYVEVGTLGTPVTPAFWTGFVASFEVP